MGGGGGGGGVYMTKLAPVRVSYWGDHRYEFHTGVTCSRLPVCMFSYRSGILVLVQQPGLTHGGVTRAGMT